MANKAYLHLLAASLVITGACNEKTSSAPGESPPRHDAATAAPTPAEVKVAATPASPVAPTETIQARQAKGPWASVEEFCAKQRRVQPCIVGKKAVVRGPTELTPGSGAITDVTLFSRGREQPDMLLGLRTEKGWYIVSLGEARNWLISDEMIFRNLDASPPDELIVRTTSSWSTADHPEALWDEVCAQSLVLCGIGSSGVPSCTKPLDTAHAECKKFDPEAGQPPAWEWSAALTYPAMGGVLVEGLEASEQGRRVVRIVPAFP